ncbi:hypothetical protein [Oceaniglobus trochenteri]|uniref:hypothetical protein n=1 Tax=Oceaniglobus trochenteri TaxID=2763260 RepID=UPI001D0006E9|nr:hypothetical protein [Oceaniglobus trochenteri]
MTDLAKLDAAATPGEWRWSSGLCDCGYVGDGGATTTLYGDWHEGAVVADDHDGLFCATLVNGYRTDHLIDPTDDAALARAGLMRKPASKPAKPPLNP